MRNLSLTIKVFFPRDNAVSVRDEDIRAGMPDCLYWSHSYEDDGDYHPGGTQYHKTLEEALTRVHKTLQLVKVSELPIGYVPVEYAVCRSKEDPIITLYTYRILSE